MVTESYKIVEEIWGLYPEKIWQPENVKILVRFRSTSRLDCQISQEMQKLVISCKMALISPVYSEL